MAGLFEKDIRILLQRKQALWIFLMISVIFGFTMEGEFVLGYIPFLFSILSVSTISYDELNNGFAFLMTMPIDAKTYVKEKYAFCLITGFCSWILSIIVYLLAGTVKGEAFDFVGLIPLLMSFLVVILFFPSIMIPIQLKFGMEKSRLVMAVLAGAITVFSFMCLKVIPTSSLEAFVNTLDSMNTVLVGIILLGIAIVISWISYRYSIRVMENKEY